MLSLEYFFTFKTGLPKDSGYSFFDATHLIWMFSAFLLVGIIVILYKKTKEKDKRKFMLVIAGTLLICEITRTVWFIAIGEYTLSDSLPFQLSRILVFIEALAIFFNIRYLKEFSYACGLLGIAAFIAPNIMEYPIVHIHTLRYSIAHIVITAVPLMWIVGDGFRPDIRYLPKIFMLLMGFVGIATVMNFSIKGANYLHIHYIPEHVNINISQPWFAFALLGAVMGFWMLIYLPWMVNRKEKYHE